MEVANDGRFSLMIEPQQLARGLRPSKRTPRNSKFLTQCIGAVGYDQVLQVIDDLENDRIDTSAITDSFPYPQMFIFTNYIIICGETKIYEYLNGSLTLKLTTTAGTLWSALDFYNFAYLSNSKVAVLREATTGIYSTTSDQPTFLSCCDFNGQVIIGSPDEEFS